MAIAQALQFLITTIFDLFSFLLIVRFLLAYAYAPFHHPATQFICRYTNFLVLPIKRIVPNWRQLELASLLALFLVAIVKIACLAVLFIGIPSALALIVFALSDIIHLFVQTFFFAIIISAILGWVQPFSPLLPLLNKITAPLLAPFQRILPSINGIDLSPIPALILLQFLSILLVDPLKQFALGHF